MRAAVNYSRRAPSVFLKQISTETYARLQEKMFLYPGFYVQPRTLRKYTLPVASHILGYVSEVDDGVIRKEPYYKPGDYIGKSGIEEAYSLLMFSAVLRDLMLREILIHWLFRDRILFLLLTSIFRHMANF